MGLEMASQTIIVTVAGADYTATNPGGRGQAHYWTIPSRGITVHVPQLTWPPKDHRFWKVGGDVRVGSDTGPVVYRVTKDEGVFDASWVGDGVAQPTPVYVGRSNKDLWNSIHLDWRRRVITDELSAVLVGETASDAGTPVAEGANDAITDARADIQVDVPAQTAESFTEDEGKNDAVTAVLSVVSPRRAFGRSLTADERKAVEERAVKVTRECFDAMGFKTKDVGKTESYDVHATKGGQTIKVEVKGTTSDGAAILLTANEVELHRSEHPNNALAVVRHIVLGRSADQPTADGGELKLRMPWQVEPERLEPIAYRYRTGL